MTAAIGRRSRDDERRRGDGDDDRFIGLGMPDEDDDITDTDIVARENSY